MQEPDPLARWEATEAITRLKAQYFRAIDTKDWAVLGSLFCDDALLDAGPTRREGAGVIVETISRALAGVVSVHHGFLPEIDVRTDGTATAVWAMTDYLEWTAQSEATGAPVGFRGYGHYHDLCVRDGTGGWRFSRVTLSRLRIDPLAGGMPRR